MRSSHLTGFDGTNGLAEPEGGFGVATPSASLDSGSANPTHSANNPRTTEANEPPSNADFDLAIRCRLSSNSTVNFAFTAFTGSCMP